MAKKKLPAAGKRGMKPTGSKPMPGRGMRRSKPGKPAAKKTYKKRSY